MNDRKFFRKFQTLLSVIILCHLANAYQGLTVETGGGYSGNLYADSFSIGDSFILGGFSISDTEFKITKFRMYYDLVYYQYDTRNSINQFDHLAGASLFRKILGEKFKWDLNTAVTYRDYAEENSDYDNYRLFFRGDAAYYLKPGLQAILLYQLKSSSYSGFENLNHIEHQLEAEIVNTFPSKTTVRGKLQYFYRKFDNNNSGIDWLDLEMKLSQSVDLRTGLSASGALRFAGDGTRPLSSYYVISGITPYWDPWDGYQLNLSMKRISSWNIVATADFGYWRRTFNFTESQQLEIPWLNSSRNDRGWSIKTEIKRQINLYGKLGRAVRISLIPGYVSNSSDDSYYEYDYFYLNLSLKLDIF